MKKTKKKQKKRDNSGGKNIQGKLKLNSQPTQY